jgi:hypothetical protein
MTILTKALLGTGAAAAALVSTASPAVARDGIDIGDIIAGAVVIGGIAAVAGAIGDNDRYELRPRLQLRLPLRRRPLRL